jgi:hypothetical protein
MLMLFLGRIDQRAPKLRADKHFGSSAFCLVGPPPADEPTRHARAEQRAPRTLEVASLTATTVSRRGDYERRSRYGEQADEGVRARRDQREMQHERRVERHGEDVDDVVVQHEEERARL